MGRVIKFQFLFKGLPHSSTNPSFNWHKKTYSLDRLINKRLDELCHRPSLGKLIAKRQFTGLTDKNGVDIYEGDVVQWANQDDNSLDSGVIEWDDTYAGFGITGEHCLDWSHMLTVIGNIYMNPELLEANNHE